MEDHATDDDGDGRSDVAGETEGGGCSGDVARFDERLESDEGRLEVGADAETGDDLEGEDAAPGAVGREVDEEAEADGHEKHPKPDWGEVLAGLS